MKRSNTIGFDARYAGSGNTTLASYARFVIEAMAEACPRYGYFRMYITDNEHHAEYEALVHRHNVEAMAPDGALWRKLPWLWRQWPIGRDMKRGDVDLYHSLTESLPFGLSRRNIRTVVTIHSLDYLDPRAYANPIESALRRIAVASSLRRADRIVAVSEGVKTGIVENFDIDSDKIDVIYRNCHPRFAEPISEERRAYARERYKLPERYILVTGRQNERKNTGLVIEALPSLPEDVHLVIAGRRTPYTDRLLRRAASLGVKDRVRLLKMVTGEDYPAIYALAAIYLLPSRYEGFATSILEALTVGVPVIASRGSSLEEAGGPDSIYVDPDDPDALAESILMVLEDEELRQTMVARGRDYITRFRSEVIAYNILNCYGRIGVDIPE